MDKLYLEEPKADMAPTEVVGNEHFIVCVLRPDQIDLIADAVVKRLMASPAVTPEPAKAEGRGLTSNDSMDNTEAHTPTRAEVEQITSDDYEPGCVRCRYGRS